MRRPQKILAVATCATAIFLSGLLPSHAVGADAGDVATDSETTPRRTDTIALPARDASIFVPGGWVQVPPQAGAAVVLRAAGDVDAQIDIRTSEPIGPPRQPNYFSAFHARIKRAGFKQTNQRESACPGDRGTEVTYLGRIDGRPFQLVICQWSVSDRVWLVSAFYPEPARRFYYPGYRRLLRESQFD